MFNKLSEFFYLKAFINIIITASKTIIYTEVLNNKGVVSSYEETFQTKYFSLDMLSYIEYFTKETPFFYVAILDNSISQGCIPVCSKNEIAYFHDMSTSEYKCFDKKWTYYTSTNHLYEIEKSYEKVGLDFIYSPFVVLHFFFKDKINSSLALFILIEEEAISLSVFNKSELLYGEYIDINIELPSEELLLLDDLEVDEINIHEEETIDLDDLDSIDEIDDFGDIADLDSIEEIEEFAESKDVEEELAETEEEMEHALEEEPDGLNEDYQRFVLIQSAINEFYKNEKFTSEFIENTYIADAIGVSRDLKKYLEEEMFLNVYVRHINLAHEVCSLAKMELA